MEIQFIYNAKNGLANSIIDLAHKIISPDTYQCNFFIIRDLFDITLLPNPYL